MHMILQDFSPLWPLLVLLINFGLAIPAAIHALMTRDQVQSAIGWTAIILLSPFVGSILYFCLGINRVSRRWVRLRKAGFEKASAFFKTEMTAPAAHIPYDTRLGDSILPFPMTGGNDIIPFRGGREAYPAMLEAIRNAQMTIALQTYIFNNDSLGAQFIDALGDAAERGVHVRVLIDGVGVAYSQPSVVRQLRAKGIRVGLFIERFFGLPFLHANLRNHRKILVVDGTIAFTGGMNIRGNFAIEEGEKGFARDTHFRITGPVADHLLAVFAQDWYFTTKEKLDFLYRYNGPPPENPPPHSAFARVIPSEPSNEGTVNLMVMMDALARAKKRVVICSPYFVPSREIMTMLKLVALRQVRVDIILPVKSNLVIVDIAATAQLDFLAACGCKIWRTHTAFDHSKIMLIDDDYAYVGSSNMDIRSLRLNFELDVEIIHPGLNAALRDYLEEAIVNSHPVDMESLNKRHFLERLFARTVWLLSPYL